MHVPTMTRRMPPGRRPLPGPVGRTDTPGNGPAIWHALDPKSIVVQRVVGYTTAGVLSIFAVAGAVIAWFNPDLPWWVGGAAASLSMAVVVLAWVGAHWWPSLVYRHTRWRLDASGLEIHRGVLWRHLIAVPAHRVQHVDVSQGPLQRIFDLATLIVHTAGTQHASVGLGGLNHAEAVRLRDTLVEFRGGNDVV